MKRRNQGFTLIEIMVAVAIIGALTAVALPAYNAYVMRGRLVEAFSALSTVQPNAEQFWSNGSRSYASFDGSNAFPGSSPNFTYALTTATTSTYVVTATGRAKAAGFVFTIDQQGNRATTGVPTGWTSSTSCWVDRKGGQCSQ